MAGKTTKACFAMTDMRFDAFADGATGSAIPLWLYRASARVRKNVRAVFRQDARANEGRSINPVVAQRTQSAAPGTPASSLLGRPSFRGAYADSSNAYYSCTAQAGDTIGGLSIG